MLKINKGHGVLFFAKLIAIVGAPLRIATQAEAKPFTLVFTSRGVKVCGRLILSSGVMCR